MPRSQDGARVARELVDLRGQLGKEWHDVRFEALDVTREHDGWRFKATVVLGSVPVQRVHAELWADAVDAEPAVCAPMSATGRDEHGRRHFDCYIASARPSSDFTPRLVAWHEEARLPAELPFIRWQR